MDAIIRFCFLMDPETLNDDEYHKIYGQAKWIWENITVSSAAKAMHSIMRK